MKTQKIILALVLMTVIATAFQNPIEINIQEGKNNFTATEYLAPITAAELIQEYPQIKSISTNIYGNTYGFVNIMGGIGSNIIIESGKTYEIYSEENITITLNN